MHIAHSLYIFVGAAYNILVYVVVKHLDRISDNNPVPEVRIKSDNTKEFYTYPCLLPTCCVLTGCH